MSNIFQKQLSPIKSIQNVTITLSGLVSLQVTGISSVQISKSVINQTGSRAYSGATFWSNIAMYLSDSTHLVVDGQGNNWTAGSYIMVQIIEYRS